MFASVMPPMATIRCSAKLDGLFELTRYKLARYWRSVSDRGYLPWRLVFVASPGRGRKNANVDALTLLERSSDGCFQAALLFSEMLNALELSAFKITQNLQFLFVQFQRVAAHFRYSLQTH
jgi:hypothetical protein